MMQPIVNSRSLPKFFLQSVYLFLVVMWLWVGVVSYMVVGGFQAPFSGVSNSMGVLLLILVGGAAYCVREVEGLNFFMVSLFAGGLGVLGGELGIAYREVYLLFYFCLLATLVALWLWAVCSAYRFNYLVGFASTLLLSLIVGAVLHSTFLYTTTELMGIGGLVLTAQVYLLASSANLTLSIELPPTIEGAICMVLGDLQGAYYVGEVVSQVLQMLSWFIWW